jgi:hypothetical protein
VPKDLPALLELKDLPALLELKDLPALPVPKDQQDHKEYPV